MQKKQFLIFLISIIFFLIYCLFLLNHYFLKAPIGNKITAIHISSGQSLNSISDELKNKKIIKYVDLFKIFLKITGSDNQIKAGDYLFDKNSPVWKVAWQISKGKHNIEPIRITLREGLNNEEMASILADKLHYFRRDLFLTSINSKQGYLFPDTYFFFPMTTTEEILEKLSNNFEKKIRSINLLIKTNGKPLLEIIIMASIIEKEASGKDDAPIISGILWKRIELGMLLQADASPITYEEKGLPENPICNPGLSSIKAALNPVDSPYLYYIHDRNRVIYFAKTYTEHKKNIDNYLK